MVILLHVPPFKFNEENVNAFFYIFNDLNELKPKMHMFFFVCL